jgi:biotin carboxyl carrier protein
VVVEARVEAGDRVERGDVLIVVEAMKMLNELRSRVPGVIGQVLVTQGQRVELGEALIEVNENQIETDEAAATI